MRYLTFSLAADPTQRVGILNGDRVVEVRDFPSMLALIAAGHDAWRRVATMARAADSSQMFATRDIRWHAPIPRPSKNVFCLGRNYAEHVREATRARGQDFKLPAHPIFFTKTPTSVIGPHDDIVWDRRVTQQVDWEAELAVVIGPGGKNIRREEAMSHVFGYTVINDVSARDLQSAHHQFFKGKSLDTFCPMGPVIVSADEYGDPHRKKVMCRVNGIEKQNGSTADMIFPVDQTIEVLSRGCTLEAGDIISTGTPDGVGMGRTPQEWLQVGDILETEVEGIGILKNKVASA
jgi:2-keto-4-pentenoate hydratase/2-oxohepta-3-ene-1,7-dioic acid hydratase in catechol pathway